MAKYVLDTHADDFNFLLIGIGSSANQYVLTNSINENLKIDLQLQDYVDLSHRLGKEFKFSLYTFLDEENNLEYDFIPNRSNFSLQPETKNTGADLFSAFNEQIDESSRLIPELTKTDYFLIIKGEEYYHHTYKILDALKLNLDILSIQEIIPDQLNSRNNLVF